MSTKTNPKGDTQDQVIEFAEQMGVFPEIADETVVMLLEGKRLFGKPVFAGPVLRYTTSPKQEGNKLVYPSDALIYDASEPNKQITFDGTPFPLTDDDSAFKEAILTLAGKANVKNGTKWAILTDGHSKQLFQVVEMAKQEKELYEKEELAQKEMAFIINMKEDEALRYGVLLGLNGKVTSIKTAMLTMLRNDVQRKMLKKFIDMNEDERFVKVLLISCIKKGNADIKKDFFQNSIGVYYNEKMLGASLDDATSKILSSTDKLDMIKIMKTISGTK